MSRVLTRFRVAVVVFVMVALSVASLGAARPAEAATPYITGRTTMRDCVKLHLVGCANRYTINAGEPLRMNCWRWGTETTGAYLSAKWFYVTTLNTSRKGYVHSSRVGSQTTVPECGTHRGIITLTWAAQHVGVRETTAAERQTIPTNTKYWAGYCATFTRAATLMGAHYAPRYAGDAKPRYYAYSSAGLVTRTGEPMVGAHVFWPNLSTYGHTAIYLGNGHVATTRGMPGATTEIQRVPTSTFGAPSGWVNPLNL